MTTPPPGAIRIHGARQNNLRNLSLELPLNQLVVVTGVSGSGKSSLVFDTLYAEGQRRYVETFSPYARQFLDRMDRPQVDRIEGIPPAIAIDQTNPVRTSRSTVGTMTELNDHLKLLYARAGVLHCRGCAQPVRRESAQSIQAALREAAAALDDPRLLVCFEVTVPERLGKAEAKQWLEAQGYLRTHEPAGASARAGDRLVVVQDRFRIGTADPARVGEAIEAALAQGRGRLCAFAVAEDGTELAAWRHSSDLHCARCDIAYTDPSPSHFSFNSPLGACPTCKGFGRVIGIDYGLVIPDEGKTLAQGAVKPWQTPSGKECQDDLEKQARAAGIPLHKPWTELDATQRHWVLQGDGKAGRKAWYGVKGFFDYLERKAYKMHVRVMLSKYRSYTACGTCHGARLQPDALLWRIGPHSVHELMLLPIDACRDFFATLQLPAPLDEATDLLLGEIRSRLRFLCEVGLGYLTLDRQSRTLSGGEVQRINLTTALGTSLVNTLFVLDEPSIGLHPRDMQRVVRVMHRLRDAGNSLVVVEHDPQIMLEADRILDMGPGAGEHGGQVVFQGTPAQMRSDPASLTGAWLAGRRQLAARPARTMGAAAREGIVLSGVTANNLKDVELRLPLQRLVCITGVSGSGKSTLVEDVLYPALQKAHGKPTETPGPYRSLRGHELISEAVMVDQSSIGRTTRSNPASYVGAFDPVRALFAALPDALERKYTAGTFSFNSGTGRCPTCGGNGFEHIEMQFLSDVYLRCSDCSGRRYRAETLEIRLEGADGRRASVADVLDMTVTEALAFFAGHREVAARLQPLSDVGLDYLRLGQPVPTLSGGEAQRLKLAGHLAEAGSGGRKLLIFDEPTTGLHFEDVARLMGAFDKLLAQGHSLLVIEHNLDVVRAADWVIDLGPEGGDAGGCILVEGTPAQVQAHATSHTGRALADYERALAADGVRDAARSLAGTLADDGLAAVPHDNAIVIHHAREHNLKNIDLRIPHGGFTVVTGVSGSGKSTLAFDIVFNEGQRRYLESLNAYARQFVQPASRPDVDAVYGIPPTVAIEQRTSRGGRKSTVGTLTEIHHFLRLLYVKLGTQHCPDCGDAIEPQSLDSIVARILSQHRGASVEVLAPLVIARKGYYTDLAKWAAGKGYAQLRVDGERIATDPWPRLARFKEHTIELPLGTVTATPRHEAALRAALSRALDLGKGVVHVLADGESTVEVFSARRACPSCGTSFPDLDPRLFSYNSALGWCGDCFGTGQQLEGFDAEQTGEETGWEDEAHADAGCCSSCQGARLNPLALAVTFQEQSIAGLAARSVTESQRFFGGLKLAGRDAAIARDIVQEIRTRLDFLARVGLGYLTLDRSAPTLSGGETQRIRLAAQLGSNLKGVCYVLDEPTIGLHPRDNRVLLEALGELAGERNTLVVVEHDEDTIRRADHVIDLGPGAGTRGGQIVGEGTVHDLMANPESITGRFLREPLRHPAVPRRAVARNGSEAEPRLQIRGARLHNLQDVDVDVPLGRLVVVTGVSGSGKSTLAREVLHANLRQLLGREGGGRRPALRGCRSLTGHEHLERVLEVDQTPIGKTPRSCPATYVGFWDPIRKLYAGTTEAGIRGYGPGRFSFNTAGGRCSACDGQGVQTVEMNFLPDVKVRCDVCGGRRFDAETLSITWRGKSVGDVLAMSVDEAVDFFASYPTVHHPLSLLRDVGLGYLTLGQQSPTLSGGEAQRIKLVTELARIRSDLSPQAPRPGRGRAGKPRQSLYVLDEPTVGLHMADVQKLIEVMHRLVDGGNSVVVVEHNLDVMAQADWIIDMGPEAGGGGGRLVVAGTPAEVAARKGSRTGVVLREFLEDRRVP
jgi:excinuclease ABC subunit A